MALSPKGGNPYSEAITDEELQNLLPDRPRRTFWEWAVFTGADELALWHQDDTDPELLRLYHLYSQSFNPTLYTIDTYSESIEQVRAYEESIYSQMFIDIQTLEDRDFFDLEGIFND